MIYDDAWVHPARQVEQARCRGNACTSDGAHLGTLVIAATLRDGLCASCARTPADDDRRMLRLEGLG